MGNRKTPLLRLTKIRRGLWPRACRSPSLAPSSLSQDNNSYKTPPFTPPHSLRPADCWKPEQRCSHPKAVQTPSWSAPKINHIFDCVFNQFWRILAPKIIPKPPKINKKSSQKRIWSKKGEFLKNSTSPTRGTHFARSRPPKTPQKSSQNAPETDQKPNQFFT